jgi:hypothetical protein
MSLPASDTFTRVDTTNLGANWTELTGGTIHTILLNQAHQPGGNGAIAYWSADSFIGDHFSQATISRSDATKSGVAARISGGAISTQNNYWFGGSTGGTPNLWKHVSGTETSLQTFTGFTLALNDVIKIEVVGTRIRCFQNGSQIGTDTTDAALSGGAPGLYSYVADYTNWSGDNVSGVTASLTGTALGGITEADVVAGGKTIIVTLTGDTWQPS